MNDNSSNTLTCAECGSSFQFSEGERKFFEEKNFKHPPKRCPDCRAEKKAKQQTRGGIKPVVRQDQRYPAVCSRCAKSFNAPFQPDGNRPVLCRDCYRS